MKSSFIKGRDKYFSKGRTYLKNEIKKNICRLNLEKYLNPVLPKQNFAQISLQVGSVSIAAPESDVCHQKVGHSAHWLEICNCR